MLRHAVSAGLGLIWVCSTSADELVYTPINPAFGGSPLNGDWLLNNAQAQDTFEDPKTKSKDLASQSELDRFNDTLERILVSRLASEYVNSLLDGNGGFLETDNYIIEAVPEGTTTTTITITDKTTGQTTTVQLDQAASP